MMASAGGACYVDGMQVNCSTAVSLINMGAASPSGRAGYYLDGGLFVFDYIERERATTDWNARWIQQQTPTDRLTDARKELTKRIEANSKCADFFGGKEKAKKLVSSFTPTFGPTVGGAPAQTDPKTKKTTIDPKGAFMATEYVLVQVASSGRDLEVNKQSVALSPTEVAAFIVAHEIGHQIGKLEPDGEQTGALSIINNGTVREACFSDIPTDGGPP